MLVANRLKTGGQFAPFKSVVAGLRVLLILFLVSGFALARPLEQGQFVKGQVSDAEIGKLITSLGDTSFRVREEATTAIKKIGLPVLPVLQRLAENEGDVEIRLRARAIVKEIRLACRMPTLVNGVEFELVMDKELVIPSETEKRSVDLKLVVKNTGAMPYYFCKSQGITLRDAKSNIVGFHSTGTEGSRRLNVQCLAKGESLSIDINAHFICNNQGLLLRYMDQSSTGWASDPIAKGAYQLSVVYECSSERLDDIGPFWLGKAETLSETILIK